MVMVRLWHGPWQQCTWLPRGSSIVIIIMIMIDSESNNPLGLRCIYTYSIYGFGGVKWVRWWVGGVCTKSRTELRLYSHHTHNYFHPPAGSDQTDVDVDATSNNDNNNDNDNDNNNDNDNDATSTGSEDTSNDPSKIRIKFILKDGVSV